MARRKENHSIIDHDDAANVDSIMQVQRNSPNKGIVRNA
jgi:hypothetical protein